MRIHSRRDRERNTTATASMTTPAFRTGMFRMVEPHIETPQRRKRFHLSTLRVCVTDRTDLTPRIRELLLVAADTRRVRIFARQRRLRCVVSATVTKQTRQARVLRILVFELRVVCLREHPRLAHARHKNNDCYEK